MPSALESYGQVSAMSGALALSNPVTLALAVGLGGLSAFSSTQQAEEELGFINDQIAGISEARTGLEEGRLAQLGLAESQFGEQLGQASYGTSQSLIDIMRQGQSTASSTGLSYSGTVQSNLERAREGVRKQFGFEKTGLENILGEKVMGIEERFAGQMGDLESELASLQYQRKQAKSRTGFGGFFKGF